MTEQNFLKNTINKFNDKHATIGIIGLGYVGLPLALRYSAVGYKVIGLDIDGEKVQKLNDGISYISHISNEAVSEARSSGFLSSNDMCLASQCDSIILCVPTPLSKHQEPNLEYIIDTIESILPYLRRGQIVSLESTTYPGTTEEELLPRIETTGLVVGVDVFLVYSPEREDPGSQKFNTQSIPKVVGGHTQSCLDVGLALYGHAIDELVAVSSTKVAEMTKLLENIHRAVNIGLVNELKIAADRMGIDIFEVVDAAATKPFGFMPYYPGPGLGGHCIPIDPFYLTWKAKEFGVHTRFIELAGEINRSMPEYVLGKLTEGLNQHGKSVSGSKILLLGVAYKKNVNDMRESPALEIMRLIEGMNGNLDYSDPYVGIFPKLRDYSFNLESVVLNEITIESYDAVVLTTDHDEFDYDLIESSAKLIIDCRGRFRNPNPRVVKA